MKKTWVVALLLSALLVAVSSARTWTDVQDRKIEAGLLRVEGEKVILKFKGKEVKFAITKLCEEDQKFIKEWQEEHKDDAEDADEPVKEAGELTLCGTKLKTGGAVTTVEEDASPDVIKSYSKAPAKPTKIKITIALPSGFDPSKPQRVMWVSAAINNDGERKRGNTGAIGIYAKTATAAGWVVIATDTDLGNPRREDNEKSEGGDLAVHTQAVNALKGAWPAFSTWEFVCCGHSGGAKASFYRVGDLLVSELNVVGLYVSGCNQDMTEDARKETRCRKSGLRKIRVWISNGKKDTISNVGHAESLQKSIKSNRYGDIKLELFEGGHSMNREEFTKAMTWFAEPKQ